VICECQSVAMQTPYDIGLVIRAVEFAAQKHRMQRRKDSGGITEPVILAAAALHDTIEDTETTEKELRTMFGDEIASLVLEMTDDKSLPKAERKRLQIEHAQHMSREAALVKLADKICNLRDVAANPPAEWGVERRAAIDFSMLSARSPPFRI
jgi:GTP diphosphokinase / guanosine-3',5'-bis(diphosphate) 3'-diphosphatase